MGVRDRLRLMPFAGDGVPGAVDPETGESWDRLNVLGHMDEFLPFWMDQMRRARMGRSTIGRSEEGYAARRRAIDGGRERGERELRRRVDAACGRLLLVLGNLRAEDLDLPLEHNRMGRITLAEAIERFLVGHLEAHCAQLADSTPG